MSFTQIKQNLADLKTKDLTDETKNEIINILEGIINLLELNESFQQKISNTMVHSAEAITETIPDKIKEHEEKLSELFKSVSTIANIINNLSEGNEINGNRIDTLVQASAQMGENISLIIERLNE